MYDNEAVMPYTARCSERQNDNASIAGMEDNGVTNHLRGEPNSEEHPLCARAAELKQIDD